MIIYWAEMIVASVIVLVSGAVAFTALCHAVAAIANVPAMIARDIQRHGWSGSR